jgi:organic radical activating enzyme
MITTIIPASSLKSEMIDELMEVPYLKVSEFYCDTIQGEGSYIGHPATFLRLTNCSLNCIYCDSKEVWRKGNPYSFQELFDLMDLADLPRKLHEHFAEVKDSHR